ICNTRAAPKAFGVGREFNSPPWHSPTLSVLKGRARDPFRAANCSHEKNAFARLHRTGPSFLLDVTPALEFLRLSGLRIAPPRKQKQLHSFFRQTDLCNLTGFIIVKNPDTNRLLARKFTRHIVMLQPVFHEKQIV